MEFLPMYKFHFQQLYCVCKAEKPANQNTSCAFFAVCEEEEETTIHYTATTDWTGIQQQQLQQQLQQQQNNYLDETLLFHLIFIRTPSLSSVLLYPQR